LYPLHDLISYIQVVWCWQNW